MKQGTADSQNRTPQSAGLSHNEYGRKAGPGGRQPYGQKVEPVANIWRPGGVAQLGNMVGDHATNDPEGSGYRGDPRRQGRGFMAPDLMSHRTCNKGSQGSY